MNHAEWDDDIQEEEGTRIISLTRNEALFIDDSVTMLIEPEANLPLPFRPLAPKALIPVPANMLDKLGAVILATADNNNQVEIELYISELYILREMCLSYITINGERVGYNLKRKVYKALLGKTPQEEELLSEERKIFENLLNNANVDISAHPLE